MALIDQVTGNEVSQGGPVTLSDREGTPLDAPPTHSDAFSVSPIEQGSTQGQGFSIYPDSVTPDAPAAPAAQAPVQQQYAPQAPQLDANSLYWQNVALQQQLAFGEQQLQMLAPIAQAIGNDEALRQQVMQKLMFAGSAPVSTSPQPAQDATSPASSAAPTSSTPEQVAQAAQQAGVDPRLIAALVQRQQHNDYRIATMELDYKVNQLKAQHGDKFNEFEVLQFATQTGMPVDKAFAQLQAYKTGAYAAPVQQQQMQQPMYAPPAPQYAQQQAAPQYLPPQPYAPNVQPYSGAGYGPNPTYNAPPPARVETPRARVSPANVQATPPPAKDWAEADQIAMQMFRNGGGLSRQ